MKPIVKRSLVVVLAVVSVVILGLVAIKRSSLGGIFQVRLTVIGGFVRVVPDGLAAVDIVDMGNGQLALIAAGNDRHDKRVKRELAEIGKRPEDVTAIFLTQGHADLAAVPTFPNAKVYALEGAGATAGKPTDVNVSRALKDGETVQVGARAVRVFAVPGHAAGSAAYWVDGVLFIGDSAMSKGDELLPAPEMFSDNAALNRQSLKELAQRLHRENLEIKAIVPAHSGVLQGSGALDRFAATH